MPHVKTAVSIQEPTYQAATQAARELKISRSQLFEQAIADYLEKIRSERLLRDLNHAYRLPPTSAEKNHLASIKRLAAKSKTKRW